MEVRELRAFVSYRSRLVTTATMIRNRLQSLLHKHNLMLSEAGLLDQAWWRPQKIISPWRRCRSARNWRCCKKSRN